MPPKCIEALLRSRYFGQSSRARDGVCATQQPAKKKGGSRSHRLFLIPKGMPDQRE